MDNIKVIENAIASSIDRKIRDLAQYEILTTILREVLHQQNIYVVESDDFFILIIDNKKIRYALFSDAIKAAFNEYKKRIVETQDNKPIEYKWTNNGNYRPTNK